MVPENTSFAAPPRRRAALGLALLCLLAMFAVPARAAPGLTAAAQLGRRLFFDTRLSASGLQSCSSCHDPANDYAAPPGARAVSRGGAQLDRWGTRAVPSLRYLATRPRFARHAYFDTGGEREDVGPAGGYMLDGRINDLDQQALVPLLNPDEMANGNLRTLAARLRHLPYAAELSRVFGAARDARALASQAAAALAAFELEDPSFHPYSSRFDRYREGLVALSQQEQAGLALFNDPAKGNCAACHTLATGPGGTAPQFTDYSYHALGVPRNRLIPANTDPRFFDLGLCGPQRADLRREHRYCGYFRTPTLRNVARRQFFFHNGRFTSLRQVLQFYAQRDVAPERWYVHSGNQVRRFDDLPARYRGNVDTSDAPLNRDLGAAPALDEGEIDAIVAFLQTLNDER